MQNDSHREEKTSQGTRRTITDPQMLLLLRRPLTSTVTWCAFEKIGGLIAAERWRREQRWVCERRAYVRVKFGSQIKKHV